VNTAYFSPMPPSRSGIADYSALLVPALRERTGVEVVKHGSRKQPRGTDLALYHVGNDPDAHGWILEALRAHPGVAVLHEWVLHHLIAGLTLGRKDVAQYLAALERDHGIAGRLLGLGVVDGCVPPLWETRPEDFPLAGVVLDATRGKGVIVHSRYVEERVRAWGYGGPVWRIPHPAWPEPEVDPVDLDGGPVIGCLGHLNASKRIPQLLEAFARVHAAAPQTRLLLVGAAAPQLDLAGRVARLGLPPEAIVREEYVDERRFWSLMAAADIVVSLRAPTMGETSGSAIRALSLGRPLVVSDVGWFAELPDAAALKVPVDERETDVLAATLELLATRADLRAAMSAAAREHIAREHALDRVADLYAAALEEAAGGAAVREAVLGEVAAAAADVGIEAGSEEAAVIAARLREARVGD
jgi:glycosyltransferase involved in cell wall biosynthesis